MAGHKIREVETLRDKCLSNVDGFRGVSYVTLVPLCSRYFPYMSEYYLLTAISLYLTYEFVRARHGTSRKNIEM